MAHYCTMWPQFFLLLWLNFATARSRIITQPDPFQNVTLNSTVTIKCVVNRQPTQLSWLKDDFGIGQDREEIRKFGKSRYDLADYIPGGLDYSLKIKRVDLSDDAKYQCQAYYADTREHDFSTVAHLRILVPSKSPRIFQKMKSQRKEVTNDKPSIINQFQNLELECRAEHGKPAAKIRWKINGIEVKANSNHRFNHAGLSGTLTSKIEEVQDAKLKKLRNSESLLTIENIERKDDKTSVECIAECEGYVTDLLASARTKIRVNYGPIVKMHTEPMQPDYVSSPHTFYEHSEVKFICNAEGRPNDFLWSWYQNDRELSNIKDSWYKVTVNRLMHNNTFKCTAITTPGEDSAFIKIQVLYGPQFRKNIPSFYSHSEGDTAIMRCEVDSNPPGQITWTKEGSSDILQRGNVLQRMMIQKEDFGTYLCTADVKDFARISKKVYLAEKGAPQIQSGPVVYARYGQMARIHCHIVAVPSPKANQVTWKKDGVMIVNGGEKNSRIESSYSERLGGAVSTLYVRGVRKKDFGTYNCSVRNGYGSTNSLIKLVPQDQIPIPFIAGASVAIVMTLLVVIVVLCVCRKGFCHSQLQKGHLHANGHNPNGMNSMELDGCLHPNYYQWSHSSAENPNNFMRFGQDIDGSSARNGSLTRYQGVELASTCSGTDKMMMQIEEEENQPEDGYSPGPNRANPVVSTGISPLAAVPITHFQHINQAGIQGPPMRTSPMFSLPSQYNPVYSANGGPTYLLTANASGNYPTLTRKSTGLVDPSTNQNAFKENNTSAYLLNSQATNV